MSELKITAVEAIPLAFVGTHDFRISEGRTRRHVSVLLRVATDDPAVTGVAEVVSAPPGKPEEFQEEIVFAIRRYVEPALVGLPATDTTAACLRVAAVLKGRAWTKAAVNVALRDLSARALGVPVHVLLGGRVRDEIPVIGPVLGIDTPERMARIASETVGAGFRTLKLKLGETVRSDIDRVAAVREAVGPAIGLRVDGNDHYKPADAIRLIRAIERFDLEHVEQPTGRGDVLGMAEVRRHVGVPIMSDDMVATPEEAMTAIRLGAVDRVKVKVTKHGLDGALAIVNMLEAAGVGAVLGHVFELGLAAAAEAQFALAAPSLIMPVEIGSLRPMGFSQDIIEEDLHRRPGFISLPEGPGLGVTLDAAAVDAARIESRPKVA
ncbi:L-Ala-D/L-Glu epimerase [Variovorax sp. PBL-H6]|uniref:mandelate racemase/muconate lactonizing enzyme family protein n=1 Tax=Variovorax sp. PBL-H6 TaxID=434009 RepID=UPI001318F355|nr:enolase C-terminal domain-like protein [Variovorax sp. PBL-H6]VTU39540.1 L-Ala-D/L-Glu epimerase [Variovorax sp. PBL-H6]